MSQNIRVRFAPSPTGPLHIGGVRTALYNFLFAQKHGGTCILRIEDTDQARYVPGAESYIIDALEWLGLIPDESVRNPGAYGPYRQSERTGIYSDHVMQLIRGGHAYYAFDTPEELDNMRAREMNRGIHSPKYDQHVRKSMKNSLTLDPAKVKQLLDNDTPFVVRMKVPEDRTISFSDVIRGEVRFHTSELDDKVILKADGFPTYHLANVVDDRLMRISHVIRGEEWLSSTAHHVLLYEGFGWLEAIPVFAHLPLILKPTGKGKLSKRDGAKFGFPVFPLDWYDKKEKTTYDGFREKGFLPEALLNFIALLGWNPGTDQEIFNRDELAEAFSLENINKSGAQFDFDKAKWFNQQYILQMNPKALGDFVKDDIENAYEIQIDPNKLLTIIELLQPRVEFVDEIVAKANIFFRKPEELDVKVLSKKYKSENYGHFLQIVDDLHNLSSWTTDAITASIKGLISSKTLKFGDILPPLRIWLTGEASGPDLFTIIQVLGREESIARLREGLLMTKNSKQDA